MISLLTVALAFGGIYFLLIRRDFIKFGGYLIFAFGVLLITGRILA